MTGRGGVDHAAQGKTNAETERMRRIDERAKSESVGYSSFCPILEARSEVVRDG